MEQAGLRQSAAGRRIAMSWSLARKVSVALVAILLFTQAIAVFLGSARFADVLSSLERSRTSFVAFTIKQKIEDRLNLGFALWQLRQVQDILELEKAREDQVLGIAVFDANGEVLFDTDRGSLGTRVPAPWLAPLADAGREPGRAFALREDDVQVVGMPLVNTLGKVEGAVALRTSAAALDQEMGRLWRGLAPDFLTVIAGFALFGVVASYLLLHRVVRRLVAMRDILVKVVAEGGEAVPAGDSDMFEQRFAAFCSKSREAIEQMDEASAEVERADRLG